MVTEFALSELTECFTPLVYAVGFYLAYFGYNGKILGDVKNGYWGYTPVDDIGYLFQMMLLLFGVDTLITLVSSFILSTFAKVNFFRESCRIMKRYWHLIALKFALKMFIFTTEDINLGMDSTGEFNWINNNGWISITI